MNASKMIDVRSDTVTRPGARMRAAIANAEVGDDVYGDDPTVNALQEFAAELLGHEAALFMPTGTQSNLVALLTHCQRGDEYIVGADAHTYKYEGGGAAALGGIQPQTVPFGENGGIDLDDVASVLKENDIHFARSRLLCLENTQHGRVQTVDSMRAAASFAREHGLKLHLDGARIGNAAVRLGVSLREIAQCFDSVSLCLSKGLGAPVGSLLLGDQAFIEEARRWRKVTGGGMRQVGMLAAAGQIALTDGLARLHEDHDNAQYLAARLTGLSGITIREGWTQTNMVWLDFDQDCGADLTAWARDSGVRLSAYGRVCRLVTHCDVDREDLDRVVEVIRQFPARESVAHPRAKAVD
ncbi:low-specificity L-threonine aldolase [Granulosicoccus sp. 3-233]|uniref:low-specificity L-threonine aldolase n=1 Tax=Granulosicoccus sp. 3-233 TaxID=3417969 RepID=UPI003D3452DC